jgi:glycosyltransferase involved in cell wall biosynthesis
MKILLITGRLIRGGTEALSIHQVNYFSKSNECGILILRSGLSNIEKNINKKVKIYKGGLKKKLGFKYLLKVNKCIKYFKPKIVLCQSNFAYFSIKLARIFTFRKQFKLYLALHYTRKVTIYEKLIESVIFNLFIKYNNDMLVASYKDQIQLFSDRYKISKNRFIIIHNGIQIDESIKNKIYAYPKEKLRILHVANYREEKDQFTLFKALSLLNNNFKNWQLYFRGEIQENEFEKIKIFLKENNIYNKVTFLEFVENVKEFYLNKDLFILTSVLEALPMSAIEACSFGIPCILTDVGGCKDIIIDGKNGYIVPPKYPELISDKILEYYNMDYKRQKEMSLNAYEIARNEFNIGKCASDYLNKFQLDINH